MPTFTFATVVTNESKAEMIEYVTQLGLDISETDVNDCIELLANIGEEPMAVMTVIEENNRPTKRMLSVLTVSGFHRSFELDYERGEGPFTQAHVL